MVLSVEDATIAVTNLRTRMPFAFGSVSIDAIPHVFVELTVDIYGEEFTGVAADHAMPKWFEKDPDRSVADSVERLLSTIEYACERSQSVDPAGTAFQFWRSLHDAMLIWATQRDIPPLLANFGVSFVERAVIDAVCQDEGMTFAEALREDVFRVTPATVYQGTGDVEVADALPEEPSRSVAVRHTVGLADPLTDDDVDEPIDDGLPETLADYVAEDGVRYVKCKLGGDVTADLDRLERIAGVLDGRLDDYGVTLDANEQYDSIGELEELWRDMASRSALEAFVDNLYCIEQPLDREIALTPDAGEMLDNWDGPPIIIDESDGELTAFADALRLGYDGTSVKSCKGVFKGLVNACLAHKRAEIDDREYLLTGEDLTTVGPVSLQQDLALVASMGFDHVERNGHHYFRGADMLPDDLQEELLAEHGDLYRRHEEGFPTLDIRDGSLALDSVVEASYGTGVDVDAGAFTPIEQWDVGTLGL